MTSTQPHTTQGPATPSAADLSAWRRRCRDAGFDPAEVETVSSRYAAYRGYMDARGGGLPLEPWFRFYRLEKESETGTQAAGVSEEPVGAVTPVGGRVVDVRADTREEHPVRASEGVDVEVERSLAEAAPQLGDGALLTEDGARHVRPHRGDEMARPACSGGRHA